MTALLPRPSELPRAEAAAGRIEYLDGIRGLCAMYVVVHHCYLQVIGRTGEPLSNAWQLLARPLEFGRGAVAIFIVLSGFCLMIPWTRTGEPMAWAKIRPYLLRRAQRILPTYYAAVAVCLALHVLPITRRNPSDMWGISMWAWSPSAILSHALLIHNWNGDWAWKIDPPMWSIATEWQIYFLFPLLLWMLRRFGGWAALLTTTFAVGLAPALLGWNTAAASPWYLGLFSLGMVTAEAAKAMSKSPTRLRAIGWSVVAALLMVIWLAASCGTIAFLHYEVVTDILGGAAGAAWILACSTALHAGTPRWWQPLTWLPSRNGIAYVGVFSYSLYLIHLPVLVLFYNICRLDHLPRLHQFIIMVTGGFAVSMVGGWVFFYLFERPVLTWLSARNKRARHS